MGRKITLDFVELKTMSGLVAFPESAAGKKVEPVFGEKGRKSEIPSFVK